MSHTIVLFDVDGTLITTGGAGRRALERAFEVAFGEPGVFDFSFAGMTDRAILRGGLSGSPYPPTDEMVEEIMQVYLEVLRDEVETAERYFVHPGIQQAIDELSAFSNVAVGLGTGNIEAGARIKLDRAELNDHFAFGGFGCDSEDRAELIGAGAKRGADRLGRALEECQLVIIGDTPRDTAAAHANRGECIAVATGGATRKDLEESGARWVFDDLSEVSISKLLALG
jgi:phosphoglycolate phosphatase-like HAD superfamily hydrolase